jgi:hypothetical protein
MHRKGFSMKFNEAMLTEWADKQAKKQFYLFLAVCPESDRKLLLSEEKMTVKDFERIQYLIDSLGLETLHSHFLKEHPEMTEALGSKNSSEKELFATDVKGKFNEIMQWQDDFIAQVPESSVQAFLYKALMA